MQAVVSPAALSPAALQERRERVFLLLAGLFLGAMAMLNIIGITRIVTIGPLTVAVGVLPYPITFLCTDLISELFGRRRANYVVTVGLLVNLLVLGTVWLAHTLPGVGESQQAPWQTLQLGEPVTLPNGQTAEGEVPLFSLIYACTAGAVLASLLAYVAAQFCDVYVFHFWKRLTRGKHLWVRNNGSTLVSQLVDSVMVVSITFGAAFLSGERGLGAMLALLWGTYAFKLAAALVDTIPVYLAVAGLSRYLDIDPREEHRADDEELAIGSSPETQRKREPQLTES